MSISNGNGAAPFGAPTPIRKVKTRVRGLDTILEGGLPEGRTTLFSGGAGTGKTVLAMEFLYRGALEGEPGVFVSFEERAEDLRTNAAAMGMDLAEQERAGRFKCLHADVPHRAVRSGEFDIQGLLALLGAATRAVGARRLVIDAVDVLMQLFENPDREREALHVLHRWLRDNGLTAVLTVKLSAAVGERYPFLDFMADCVLRLDQRMEGQVRTRRLNVIKCRGSRFLSNEQPYVIGSRGMTFIPVASMSLTQAAGSMRISSGHDTLDSMLGGGYLSGTGILLTGPSGAGKTTLASLFSEAACLRDERVLYISYEEAEANLVQNMASARIDMQSAVKSGNLKILSVLPEAMGMENHLLLVLDAIEAFAPRHLVVDAISACKRMGTLHAAFDFLMRILTKCRGLGVTCLFTNQAPASERDTLMSGIGISSLIDTLLTVQFSETGTSLGRRLTVVKSRGSMHSMAHHSFRITSDGLEIDLPDGDRGPRIERGDSASV